jgi:hypothetical protein
MTTISRINDPSIKYAEDAETGHPSAEKLEICGKMGLSHPASVIYDTFMTTTTRASR